jgi:hypothetical protein
MTTAPTPQNGKSASKLPKFLTQLQQAAVRHGHAEASAEAIAGWCRRFILFLAFQAATFSARN